MSTEREARYAEAIYRAAFNNVHDQWHVETARAVMAVADVEIEQAETRALLHWTPIVNWAADRADRAEAALRRALSALQGIEGVAAEYRAALAGTDIGEVTDASAHTGRPQ